MAFGSTFYLLMDEETVRFRSELTSKGSFYDVLGSRDGAVVRALASHQSGPGLIPGLGVICVLSLLLVLVLAPRGFSPGVKNQHFKIPIGSGK